MPEIGVRQLKNEASEILRAVREEKIEYTITLRGQPVALLRPIKPAVANIDALLALTADVFCDLGEDELAEVEALIQRRADFFGEDAALTP
jgi:prevent-host-death family protein